MNDSTTVSNGTIFGIWPLGRSMLIVGTALVVLFVLIQPEASRGLGFFERTLFWVVHVGVGLTGLYLASRLLVPRAVSRLPAWLALLLAGLAGAIVLVPVSLLLEHVLPASLQAIEEDSWMDAFAARGLWQELLVEFVEVTPEFVAIWMALNLPFLTAKPQLNDPSNGGTRPGATECDDVDQEEASRYARQVRDEFLERLPKSIGTNVLAISSDLHYLHIYTDQGRCMILGSLQRATVAMGDEGLRIHRAHWVARGAVERIVKDGRQWYCGLCNGLKIPVSRRNRSTVAGWFGHGARVVPLAASRRDVA